MDVITILQNKVSELIEQQRTLIDMAINGDPSAMELVKAYESRISSVRNTIMEVQGLGETVMLNQLEIKSKQFE